MSTLSELDNSHIMVNAGDERAFVSLEEQVVYRLQRAWRSKPELADKPCVEISARLEEHLYQETRTRFRMEAGEVWQQSESIEHFRALAERVIASLERREDKDIKRLYGKHADIEQLFRLLAKEDKASKSAANAAAAAATASGGGEGDLSLSLSGTAKPAKASRSAKVKAEKTEKTPRTSKKAKSTAVGAGAAIVNAGAGPTAMPMEATSSTPFAASLMAASVATAAVPAAIPAVPAPAAAVPAAASLSAELSPSAAIEVEIDMGEDMALDDMEFDFEEG